MQNEGRGSRESEGNEERISRGGERKLGEKRLY